MLDTESRHSTGLDQGPTRDPWLTMDYYLGTDSLSLQEMLDVDIKCEIESVIGGHPELGFNFTDLSPLELDDDPVGCQGDLNNWLGSASLLNGNSNSSQSNFNLDLSGGDASTIMVNPNSVMPHIISRTSTTNTKAIPARRNFSFPKNDIKEEKTEDSGDSEIINEMVNQSYENDITETEGEEDDDEDEEDDEDAEQDVDDDNDAEEDDEEDEEDEEEDIQERKIVKEFDDVQEYEAAALINSRPGKPKHQKIYPKTITPVKTLSPIQTVGKMNSSKVDLRMGNFKFVQNSNGTVMQHAKKQIYNNNIHTSPSNNCTMTMKRDKDFTVDLSEYDEKPYPKPAYSYSCLIAMALKNSQTGSLPVSEIYNFMCEHFPYFKTAPNGWKNSVRHNLSLNKCFEKIEKPAGNGNQRKGCLWAINPQKVAKMDEEVQKWSRKDPLAIKKAMIYPDHLELLERGEMKYAGSGGDVSEETESSGDETAEENVTYDEPSLGHTATNSVTDSYDESSQDCDIDISEHVYDDVDIDDNKDALHMQLNITKQEQFAYELSPSIKRQKTVAGTIQGNYVYQSVPASRRKTPLLVRTSASTGAFLKIE
ncbi:uncharacterized protein jumu [Chelonus insularis]|uniref:uncharacterized protein jumu n=1 Tax=Chelonus insularis TaxID=460826 RepID=UPI00158B7E76|nr:uncharacterized protein LOC118074261 [Chelonus insularis]